MTKGNVEGLGFRVLDDPDFYQTLLFSSSNLDR